MQTMQSPPNNDPSCIPGFHQIPTVTLYPSCPPAKWCCILVFDIHSGCVSKPDTVETPIAGTHIDSLGEGGQCQLVPEDCCTTSQWFLVYDDLQYTAGARVCCPQLASLFLYWLSRGSLYGSFRALCLRRGILPLSNVLQAGEPLLPMWCWGSLLPAAEVSPYSSNQSSLQFPRCKPANVTDLWNFRLRALLFIENWW